MIELLKIIVPYPFAFRNSLYDGYNLKQSKYCKKCNEKFCFQKPSVTGVYACKNGFSCFPIVIEDDIIIINGLITPETRANFKGLRKETYKEYVITSEGLSQFQSQLSMLIKHVRQTANDQVKDSVAFLHDIRTSVSIVLSWCQQLIAKQQGASFEEQLEKVDKETANLFGSINLLEEQLNLADIIANYASITYGKKHKSGIHGFIFKMVKLFEPRAEKKSSKIWLYGKTNAEIQAYNSFQFIPLILLDNAVKYTYSNQEIRVELTDIDDHVLLTFKSYGKIVPHEYRDKIFEKYFRGPRAVKQNPHGMGLGLYIARLIAKAHGSDIFYKANVQSGDIGFNEFSISVHKAL